MSETTLKEMSLEELDVRGAELRNDLCDLSEGERSDENGEKITALLREVDVFDKVYTLARHQHDREQRAREQEALNSLAPRGANGNHQGEGVRSVGDMIINAEEVKDWIERGMPGHRDTVGVATVLDSLLLPRDLGLGYGVRALDEFGSGGPGNASTGNINTLLPVGQPIAPMPRQARLSMRDLIPSQPTTLPSVPFVRELSPTANELAASAVAEGNTKPDASLNFQGQTANPTVIAVSVSPSKQLWADAALVVAYINQRLPYLYRFKEDAEIINGSGTWPDMLGIRNSGVQTQAAVSGEFAQTIGLGIAGVENADGVATGVAMNPTDAWNMFIKRAAGGSGTFDAGSPFSIASVSALTVWGLPTVRSRVYTQGKALVGDYAHGAMILDREGVNVQIYPQHSDYALRNQILVLCEGRSAVATWRPDLFVDCTLD